MQQRRREITWTVDTCAFPPRARRLRHEPATSVMFEDGPAHQPVQQTTGQTIAAARYPNVIAHMESAVRGAEPTIAPIAAASGKNRGGAHSDPERSCPPARPAPAGRPSPGRTDRCHHTTGRSPRGFRPPGPRSPSRCRDTGYTRSGPLQPGVPRRGLRPSRPVMTRCSLPRRRLPPSPPLTRCSSLHGHQHAVTHRRQGAGELRVRQQPAV